MPQDISIDHSFSLAHSLQKPPSPTFPAAVFRPAMGRASALTVACAAAAYLLAVGDGCRRLQAGEAGVCLEVLKISGVELEDGQDETSLQASASLVEGRDRPSRAWVVFGRPAALGATYVYEAVA